MKRSTSSARSTRRATSCAYVRDVVEATGVGRRAGRRRHDANDQSSADVKAGEVAGHHPDGASGRRLVGDRGEAVGAMAVALEAYVRANVATIAGIIGIGGSGGTALITPAMRALPVGVPKVMVSTVASGNVAHVRRRRRHRDDVLGHRRRRPQPHLRQVARQRRQRRRRHGRPTRCRRAPPTCPRSA